MRRDPKNVFEHYFSPKISPLGPEKAKKNPKIRSKLKVRIEGSRENKSCLSEWVDPKNVFEPYYDPNLAHWGPKKPKCAPKLGQTQKQEVLGA